MVRCNWNALHGKAAILRFRGEHFFLSNFYTHEFIYKGTTYRTAEHAYQSQKTTNVMERRLITEARTPGDAKRLGRKATIRDHWDTKRLSVIRGILKAKFSSPEMAKLLLSTGSDVLIEGNDWGDVFWGVGSQTGIGHNYLGQMLMEIRSSIRGSNEKN